MKILSTLSILLLTFISPLLANEQYATLTVEIGLKKDTPRTYMNKSKYSFSQISSDVFMPFEHLCKALKVESNLSTGITSTKKQTHFLVQSLLNQQWKLVSVSSKPYYKDQYGFHRFPQDVYHFTKLVN